jgi:hypothetical protein
MKMVMCVVGMLNFVTAGSLVVRDMICPQYSIHGTQVYLICAVLWTVIPVSSFRTEGENASMRTSNTIVLC